jgi:hypothetical protein
MRRFDRGNSGAAQEGDAELLFEKPGQQRDRRAGFDADFVRTIERDAGGVRAQAGNMRLCLFRREFYAAFCHLGAQESIDHRFGFAKPGGEHHAALDDRDTGLIDGLRPDIARPPRHRPAIAGALAGDGDGDEAKIADRGAIGLRIAVDDDNSLAAFRRRIGMGEATIPAPTTARS